MTYFSNGNLTQIYPHREKRVDYVHNTGLTKTRFKDGLIALKDAQTLIKFYPDGTQVIAHSDGQIKVIDPKGKAKIIYKDGRVERLPFVVDRIPLLVIEKGTLPKDFQFTFK